MTTSSTIHDCIRVSGAGADPDEGAAHLDRIFDLYGTLLRTRRRQQVPLALDNSAVAYLVTSGMIAIHANKVRERSLILSVLYPGDLLLSEALPPTYPLEAVAAGTGSCLRIRSKSIDEALSAESCFGRALFDQICRQQARLMLRIETFGRLSSEERVAAFLIEAGLRIGVSVPGGIAFDVLLSRNDIAAYLALNPDTLSRQMSYLRERSIVEQMGRGKIVIRDWEALRRDCPIAGALDVLHLRNGSA